MAAHPTIGDMIKQPYGVVENYVDPDGQSELGLYAGIVNKTVPDFEYHYDNFLSNFLLRAAQNERSKEIKYINEMMENFDDDLKNSTLYNNFLDIYKGIMSGTGSDLLKLSSIVDTIQKMKLGLYELDKTVMENYTMFKDINLSFLDVNMMDELKKILKFSGAGSNTRMLPNLNLKMTGSDIIDTVTNNIKIKMEDSLKNSNINTQSKEGKKLLMRYQENIEKIVQLYNTKLKQYYTAKFEVIDKAETILGTSLKDLDNRVTEYDKGVAKSKRIKVTKDGNPKTLQKTIVDIFVGSFGGKSPEYNLDIMGGGMNTGNIKNTLGLSIDADNIQIASGKMEFYFNNKRDRTQWDEIEYFGDFLDQVKKIENFESKFMIMYSDKDQSVSKEFGKTNVAHRDVKIKGDASLKKRGQEIIEMYNLIEHPGEMDPTDLIFSLANLSEEFVCNGNVEQAKRTLGAICVGWMFDDVKQIITGSSLISGVDTIHFYNINNYYYTLSDILYKTSEALESKNPSKYGTYVSIGISLPQNKIYATILEENSPEEGMPRWEAISDTLLSNTKINIHMNPKNLFNELFSDIFGKI